jgi:hypothetical protein
MDRALAKVFSELGALVPSAVADLTVAWVECHRCTTIELTPWFAKAAIRFGAAADASGID